jgi:mono/diheme cytochrome c family protein
MAAAGLNHLARNCRGPALAICAVFVAQPALSEHSITRVEGPAPLPGQQHLGQYAQSDIVKGAQIYAAQCAVCHGLAGNAIAAADVRTGRFRTAVSDDDLKRVIRAGVPASGMPPLKLDDGELTAIVAFIRAGMNTNAPALAVKIGDAARGRAIVEGKAGCLKCHRINDQGGRSGPDLSGVGSSRSPASIHQSLIEPSKSPASRCCR